MLASLAVLAALSAIATELPRVIAWPTAVAAVAYGLWLARRESRQPVRSLVITGDAVTIDETAVEGFAVAWRGPLAFVRWRDGRGSMQRLPWWPDILPATERRELRLAAAMVSPPRTADSMAP